MHRGWIKGSVVIKTCIPKVASSKADGRCCQDGRPWTEAWNGQHRLKWEGDQKERGLVPLRSAPPRPAVLAGSLRPLRRTLQLRDGWRFELSRLRKYLQAQVRQFSYCSTKPLGAIPIQSPWHRSWHAALCAQLDYLPPMAASPADRHPRSSEDF